MTAPAAPPLTDRELRYLTVVFSLALQKLRGVATRSGNNWKCSVCDGMAPDRLAVVHAPGCVFFALDAHTLAAISADWTPER